MTSIGSIGGYRPPPPKPPSFETLDGDGSGVLSLDEFKSGAPQGADGAKSETLFKSIDSDADGAISKDESDAFKSKAEQARQQLQSFLFGLQSGGTDKTADGTSGDEDDVFGRIDADSSGGISQDEFLKAFSPDRGSASSSGDSSDLLNTLFEALDANADGAIDEDEQTAPRQAAQDRKQDRGPPPSSNTLGAAQAYGGNSQLASQRASLATYAKAA